MKHAIVTGANSFIGNAVINKLVRENIEVTALCRMGHDAAVPRSPRVHIYNFDLMDLSALTDFLPTAAYDTFFHFAWAGGAKGRYDCTLQLHNIGWTTEALKTAVKLGCSRFIGAGSIMEHESLAAAQAPGNKPGMGYIYGCAKLAAHTISMSVAANLGIDLVWAQITNAYGAGEISPRMINTTIRKCLNGVAPEFTAATQNYDFVYIDDVADALYLIAEYGHPFTTYLVGSSSARPLKEFLTELRSVVAPELEFKFGALPFTGVNLPLTVFDCRRTELDTGFRATVDFATGVHRTAEWLKEFGR